RTELNSPYTLVLGRDARFTFDDGAIFQLGAQLDICGRGWINDAFNGEDFGCEPDRDCEIAGHAGHCGKEQISEAVVVQSAVAAESKTEQVRHEMLVFGQSNHAIANVARRKHSEFFPKPARAASVIGYGNDYG